MATTNTVLSALLLGGVALAAGGCSQQSPADLCLVTYEYRGVRYERGPDVEMGRVTQLPASAIQKSCDGKGSKVPTYEIDGLSVDRAIAVGDTPESAELYAVARGGSFDPAVNDYIADHPRSESE